MLTARYLADCPDEIVKIYSQLENDVLQLIAKRIAKNTKDIKEITEWQMLIMRECNLLRSDVEKLIAKYDKQAQKIILQLFDEAMKKSFDNDLKMAQQGMSENQRQHIETLSDRLQSPSRTNKDYAAMVKKYANDFSFNQIRRLTATIADSSQTAFIEQANNAYMQVASGAIDYNTAIKNACHALASKGVYTVDYSQSGKTVKRTIESAVRANVITGINQSASEQTLKNSEALENDLVETSAHLGARNKDGKHAWSNHEAWQGRVFHLGSGREYVDGNGATKYAPSFQESCGLGFADGICGVNCRHSYYPYFEGTKQTFSALEEDKIKIDDETEITRYEAEQKLRYYERGVRYWKRHADVLAAAGEDNTQARMKVAEWQQKAKDWTDKTGLRRDYAREFVGSSKDDERQIYGLGRKNATGGRLSTEQENERQEKFASTYYETIRNRKGKSDIMSIAQNTGMSETSIAKIREHVFVNKHKMADGRIIRFNSDPNIAHAWQRLEQGKGTELDKMLLRHEWLELTLMNKKGYNYETAHLIASKKYPWEYKLNKNELSWTDDEIQADIKSRLEELL